MKPRLDTTTKSNESAAKLAAQEIMKLINSRPYSPRHDEIVTIIETLVVRGAANVSSIPLGLDEYGPEMTSSRP